MAYLVVVDRIYRGSLEAQFFDALYGVQTFREQLGAVDLVLRGTAVSAAIDTETAVPSVRLGDRLLDTMPDPRAAIRYLVERDMTVYVDQASLALFGVDGGAVIPGCTAMDTTELAPRWAEYEHVWFL